MVVNGTGGANTTKSGRPLEESVKSKIIVKNKDYVDLTPYEYDEKNKKITHRQFCSQFFKYFKKKTPNRKEFSPLLPDNVFYNPVTDTVKCIEVKNQNGQGSVDEKIQTGLYKVWWLLRLFRQYGKPLSHIKYSYVLADKFKEKKYEPVYEFYNYFQDQYKKLKEKYGEDKYSDLFELWDLINAVSIKFYSDIENENIIIED